MNETAESLEGLAVHDPGGIPKGLVPMQRADGAEFVKQRTQGLGGSDIAKILGKSSWGSPWSVQAEKLGVLTDDDAGEAAEWGTAFERSIARVFAKRTGKPLVWSLNTYFRKDAPHIRANPDFFLLDENALGDCKLKNSFVENQWGPDHTDLVPEDVFFQQLWYLHLFEREVSYVPVNFGGQKLRVFEVKRDVELGQWLEDFASSWWTKHVVNEEPVTAIFGKSADAFMKKKFPKHTAPLRDATAEEVAHALKLFELRARMDDLSTEKETAENALKLSIGDAEGINDPAGRFAIRWKKNNDGEKFDAKEFVSWLKAFCSQWGKEGLTIDGKEFAESVYVSLADCTHPTIGARPFVPGNLKA